MDVEISSGLIDAVLAHAAAEPDHEVCGLLLGAPDAVVAVMPAANVSPGPADSFEIDPLVLFAAHRAARAGGPAVIGHYHSHPRGSCEPSGRDAACAVPGQLWLIVAIGQASLFVAMPGGAFRRCTITIPRARVAQARRTRQKGRRAKMVKVGRTDEQSGG